MNLAKVTLIGNVGRDPEMKMTPNGKSVTEFSVAVGNKRGDQEHTDWYRVSVWGGSAERAQQFVSKGRRVYVEGKLEVRAYTDREGKDRYSLDVNASDWILLDKREAEPVAAPAGGFNSDEIPF